MLTAARRKLFTVDDYYALGRAGVLGEQIGAPALSRRAAGEAQPAHGAHAYAT